MQLINSGIETIFFNYKDLIYRSDLAEKIREELIQKTFEYHLEHNKAYAEYAKRLGYSLNNIPLLPSSFFKGYHFSLSSVPESTIIKQCTSSGTQGTLSIVPRDELTLMHFLSSISASFPTLLNIDRAGNHKGLILGPSTEGAGNLWFSYAMACLTLQMTAISCEPNKQFDMDFTVQHIKQAVENNHDLLIVGPPFRILELCETLRNSPYFPGLSSKSFIISAGGWKKRQNKSINKDEFIIFVADTFQVKPSQVRDCFNMVELNTILLECAHHRKHIPPWLKVQARDPKTNALLPDGVSGILAFLDPTAMSYPCFILSEDIGTISESNCPCGQKGKVISIERRLERIEARGCALKMASGLLTQEQNNTKNRYHNSFYRNPDAFLELAKD